MRGRTQVAARIAAALGQTLGRAEEVVAFIGASAVAVAAAAQDVAIRMVRAKEGIAEILESVKRIEGRTGRAARIAAARLLAGRLVVAQEDVAFIRATAGANVPAANQIATVIVGTGRWIAEIIEIKGGR